MHRVLLFLPCAAIALALSLSSSPARAASLEALPDRSMPGSEVIARGDGYPASTAIDFELVDTGTGQVTAAGSSVAGADGRLFDRLRVPEVAPGSYRLRGRVRGTVEGSTLIEIVAAPALTLSPTTAPPGTLVDASFGPVDAGQVTLFYDEVPVLGPLQHPGGPFQASFLVPADRPDPLGSVVTVRAEQRIGGSIAATAATTFQSRPEAGDQVVLTQFSGPGEPLSPGEPFTVSGRVQVPSNRQPSDYDWTAAVRASDGRLIPVNLRPIAMDAFGNFSIEAVMPGVLSGFGYLEFPPTTDLGLVYKVPGLGNDEFLQAVVIEYEPWEVQNLSFHVFRLNDSTPVEDAVVTMTANTLLVPEGWDYEEDGIPGLRAGDPTLQKPVWSAAYAPPNQYHDAISQAFQDITQSTNSVTGCPFTLASGLTDVNGDWDTNAVPWLNWLLDAGAQSASRLDINTFINSPGKATFSARVSGVHLGLGWVNKGNECTGVTFDFQFDYGSDTWKFRTDPNSDFILEFDPNQAIPVALADCSELPQGIPADPIMPGLPSQKVVLDGKIARRFGAIWSFPDTNGANLIINQVPQLRLPHASDVFGLLDNPTLFIGTTEIGPLTADVGCGDLEYVIDLPQLTTFSPGLHDARIEATMFSGVPVTKRLQLDVRPGPTWINQAADYVDRIIQWSPSKVTLMAAEPERFLDANATNIGYGIGDLDNDNATDGFVTQVLLPSGSSTRHRTGGGDSTAANLPNDPVGEEANGSGSSLGDPVKFGDEEAEITVLDTGKIPLFRYAWGIPPIASATVGADIWFRALYSYWGNVVMTNSQVLTDATAKARAEAGLDLWIDASVILDLVSISAFALPNFELTMPLVIVDNQFDSAASQPCFDFALDVSWEVQVGWCPFCVKAGDLVNLFTILEGNGCPATATKRAPRATPVIPPIDRTSLAVDGFGRASLVWGDGSGDLLVQAFNNGLPDPIEALAAGPGAMGATHAYFDSGKAVVVWSQSALSEAAFLALDGDPADPLDGDFTTAMANQHLAYRVNDGMGWSAPMNLTLPSGGDGGVVLAACPASDPACPAGGEVLAVWVHDASANINLHDLKLKYSFFDGVNWGPIRDVDAGSTAKDLQPTATYLDGQPVVFWVRNPSVVDDGVTATFDLNQRRLAYRFLRETAGVQEPATLPMGVASPSVQAFGTNAVVLAYSVATESDAFLGTRRSLHTAYGTQCFNGVCQFGSTTERTDQGRRIYVERPSLTRNQNGQGVITFRQLGVDNPSPDDPEGVLKNTGALMQLIFDFQPSTLPVASTPFELSSFGAVNWRVDSVFDPASNAVLTSAVQVGAAGRSQAEGVPERPGVKARRFGSAGATLLVAERPMQPDFELDSAAIDPGWIPNGGSADLTVRIRNNGTDWGGFDPVTVATYWDGPPGLGRPGPSRTFDDLVFGDPVEFTMPVPLPADFDQDETHSLFVVINPQGELDESDGSNNSRIVEVGALPVPINLVNVDGDASGNIVIHWDPVDDPRVTGYRVYRRNPDGSVLNVGMSPVAGFADFSAYPRQRYSYFVTSIGDRLAESAWSAGVEAWTLSPDEIFQDGFE